MSNRVMSCYLLVILCAVGAVSSLPILQEDKGGGEVLKSEGRSEGSIEKTICIRYKDNSPSEANQVTDNNYPWLMIKLGKSQPKVVNYKILTIDESGPDDSGGQVIQNDSNNRGKMIPTSSEGKETGVITSIHTNCSSRDENRTKTIDGHEAYFETVKPGSVANATTYSNGSSSNKDFGEPISTKDTSTNSSNFNATKKNVIHPEIVTDSQGLLVDVILSEDSGSTTEVLFPLTEPEDHATGSKEVEQKSHIGSDEEVSKSTEIDQNRKEIHHPRAREGSANTDMVSKPGTEHSNVSTFPPDIITNGHDEIIEVIVGNDTDNELHYYTYEMESTNGTDLSGIRNQINENNGTLKMNNSAPNNDDNDLSLLTTLDTTTSPSTNSGSSNDQTTSRNGEITEAIPVSVASDKDNDLSTPTTLDTVTLSTKSDSSDNQINSSIGNVTEGEPVSVSSDGNNDISTLDTVTLSTKSDSSDNQINSSIRNVTEGEPVSVSSDGNNDISTLDTVTLSTKSDSSDNQINSSIGNVPEAGPVSVSSDGNNDISTLDTDTLSTKSDSLDNQMNTTTGNVTEPSTETVTTTAVNVLNSDNVTAYQNQSTTVSESDEEKQIIVNGTLSLPAAMNTTTAFTSTTKSMADEDGFKSEPITTTELSVTNSTPVHTSITTLGSTVSGGSSSEKTSGQQLPTSTSVRLEPTPVTQTPTTAGISQSPPGDSTNEVIDQPQMPITPSTIDSQSSSGTNQKVLPIQPTPPDWGNFNNFTLIFPTRPSYYILRPIYYI